MKPLRERLQASGVDARLKMNHLIREHVEVYGASYSNGTETKTREAAIIKSHVP